MKRRGFLGAILGLPTVPLISKIADPEVKDGLGHVIYTPQKWEILSIGGSGYIQNWGFAPTGVLNLSGVFKV